MLAGLLPVRPLEYFVAGWSELLASASPGLGLAVFGGGAGGVNSPWLRATVCRRRVAAASP
jgi:hypothetical protein